MDASIIDVLCEQDNFTVDWAGRDEHGNLMLEADVFKVAVTPAPMFGQNLKDFGLDVAAEQAETEEYEDHDFGACYVRQKSLRLEADGRWYVDLSVPSTHVRHVKVATMLVDDDGDPVLGDDGKPQVKFVFRKESWITCELSQLKPMADHPLCGEYRQSDRRTVAQVRAKERTAALAAGSKGGRGRGKGKRKRLSPTEIAELLNA